MTDYERGHNDGFRQSSYFISGCLVLWIVIAYVLNNMKGF